MPKSEAPSEASPLRVAVLVDLVHRPDAGGHVKAWEKLATAAVGLPGLDLAVHFVGDAPALRPMADNVRFQLHPPAFSTARLPFLSYVPDHTDLARYHRELAQHLTDVDLIHTTDAYFAFARTAERIAQRRGVTLTNSVHTDTPDYTRLFTATTIDRLFGGAPLWYLFTETLHLPQRMEAHMRRRLLDHQRLCAAALVSRPDDLPPLARALSPERVGLLRRGIDRELFTPHRRDRAWLEANFEIPPEKVVILYVGRIDRAKNILTLVDAVDELVRAGRPMHLLCAGAGAEQQTVRARLGTAASCPGTLEPDTLARVYASVDVVAHPSEIEESSNVALEALASGRPLITTERVARDLLTDGENALVVPAGTPGGWSAALDRLTTDAPLRQRMGAAARHQAETALPTWRDVLEQDLLAVWRRAHAEALP